MNRERFTQLVRETMDSLPARFRERIRNVAVVVEDYPPDGHDTGDGLLMGVFEGIGATEKSVWDLSAGPDRVVLYQKNIESVCRNRRELVREILALGYRPTIVSVDLEQGEAAWAGQELSLSLVAQMEARGADPCGERGEYHTFVSDGPLFHTPVLVQTGETVEQNGHRLVDLVPR